MSARHLSVCGEEKNLDAAKSTAAAGKQGKFVWDPGNGHVPDEAAVRTVLGTGSMAQPAKDASYSFEIVHSTE